MIIIFWFMFMCCVHLSTFVSRECVSRITYVCQSVIKTPKHLRIMPITHGCTFFRKPKQPLAIILISHHQHKHWPSCHLSIKSISHHANQMSCLSAMPICHHYPGRRCLRYCLNDNFIGQNWKWLPTKNFFKDRKYTDVWTMKKM